MSMHSTHAKPGYRTRIFALAALASFASGVVYAGRQAWLAWTDSFVAPIILSPESDLVLTSKMKLTELEVERARIVTEMEEIDADVAAGQKVLERLRALEAMAERGADWSRTTNALQTSAAAAELRTLDAQHTTVTKMIEAQERAVAAANANVTAGLVSISDASRERQTLDQMRLGLLENERARQQLVSLVRQLGLAHDSLAGGGPRMPELIVRDDQIARVELEILRLESEARTKRGEKKLLAEKLAKLDDAAAQLRDRPLFRAIDRNVDVAFVPYTQIDGVHAGADVYRCTWGLFACAPVGRVTEMVPGEVVLPDPWGNPARGQYAVLELRDAEAAREKTLRVRCGTPVAPADMRRASR